MFRTIAPSTSACWSTIGLPSDLVDQQADRLGHAQPGQRHRHLHRAVAAPFPARGLAVIIGALAGQGGQEALQLVGVQGSHRRVAGDLGAVDADDGIARRVRRTLQVVVAALQQAQVTVGDLAVQVAVAVVRQLDEAVQVARRHRGHLQAFFQHPGRELPEHELVDGGRLWRERLRGEVPLPARGQREVGAGDEIGEAFDGIGIPGGEFAHAIFCN
jgi:hypothetical protein